MRNPKFETSSKFEIQMLKTRERHFHKHWSNVPRFGHLDFEPSNLFRVSDLWLVVFQTAEERLSREVTIDE